MVAVPLGPWVEFRRKRPVMMTMDLTRFAALMTIPAAYALGWLSFAQLLVVSVVVAAAKIAFNAASGANLKTLVKPEDLLVANSRFESTTWTTLVVGPPLGGAAVGLLGPVTTVIADAVSYLLSACGVAAIGGREPRPARPAASGRSAGELLDGWRHILGSPALRPVFFNRLLVGGLILAVEPELAVLMLGTAQVRAVAVHARVRRALYRRAHRIPAVPPARHPVRAAPGHAGLRHAVGLLAGRPRVHRAGTGRRSCS